MKSALFVSHKGQRCGVYQFGRRVFKTLQYGGKLDWTYLECDSAETLAAAMATGKPDIVLLNYHPATLAWASTTRWQELGAVVFCIFHEVHQEAADAAEPTFFDFLLCPDPTLVPRNPIIVPVPRITIDYEAQAVALPGIFTVGCFGFATPGKGFDLLCAEVNTEFDCARIRLNIPPHDSEDMAPEARTDAIVVSCRQAITKPGIDLVVTHDFMDDDALMAFLGSNTLNAFLYEEQTGRGITSCADYALASGRPLAVSRSSMFRHLHEITPSICVDDCSLKAIAARNGAELAPWRQAYIPANAGAAWEEAILAAVDRRALSLSVPGGCGFNKLLDDRARHAYAEALQNLHLHAAEMLTRKIERANVQQAFALDTALRFLPQFRSARILGIGSYEDTAVATLKALGYQIDEVDPNVNGLDLSSFYRLADTRLGSYDLILCVSVLEHVHDDAMFMRMTADLLAPDGVAVFTVDFAGGYASGMPKPLADERLYTTADIRNRLMVALPDCTLLDTPAWRDGAEDFEYDGCRYGFAGWVFRKFSGETLQRALRGSRSTPAWKSLLAAHSEETPKDGEVSHGSVQELLDLLAAHTAVGNGALASAVSSPPTAPSAVSPLELDAIYRRLIYDLRFDGGSRELRFGLKLARLIRKISWQIRPAKRRKLKIKKAEAEAAAVQHTPFAMTPALVERLDSVLITLALDRRSRREPDSRYTGFTPKPENPLG